MPYKSEMKKCSEILLKEMVMFKDTAMMCKYCFSMFSEAKLLLNVERDGQTKVTLNDKNEFQTKHNTLRGTKQNIFCHLQN